MQPLPRGSCLHEIATSVPSPSTATAEPILSMFDGPARQFMRQSTNTMAKVFAFSTLATSDLVIDGIYEGGTKGRLPAGALV